MLPLATHNLNAPAFSNSNEFQGGIYAIADARWNRKPPRSDPHFKTIPLTGDRSTEHPLLCLENIVMFIEPSVVITGVFIKDTA
jgi:hypothetical protein